MTCLRFAATLLPLAAMSWLQGCSSYEPRITGHQAGRSLLFRLNSSSQERCFHTLWVKDVTNRTVWQIEAVSPGRLSLGMTTLCANDFPLWYGRVPTGTIQQTEAEVLEPGKWYYVGLDESFVGTVSINEGPAIEPRSGTTMSP